MGEKSICGEARIPSVEESVENLRVIALNVPRKGIKLVCSNFKRLGGEGPKLLFWTPVDLGPVAWVRT